MAAVETIETPRRESRLATLGFYVRRYPLGAAGAVIVAAFVLMAIFAPWITQFDPTVTNPRMSLAYPGGAHPLGADFMGRDMWSRVVYGARISLAVGLGSTGLGCVFGVTIGLTGPGIYSLDALLGITLPSPLLFLALAVAALLVDIIGLLISRPAAVAPTEGTSRAS